MINCTIIGSSSFLASTITDLLMQEAKYSVNLLGRKTENYCFDYPVDDIEQSTDMLLKSDVIIYCAGAGIQPQNTDHIQSIYGLNTFQPYKLMQILSSNNYSGRLITFGSYFEIGEYKGAQIFTEEDILSANNKMPNDYCRSKRWLTELVNQSFGIEPVSYTHAHLILTNVYGAEENEKRLFPYLFHSLSDDQPVHLTSGLQVRQYTHVSDIASFVCERVIESQEYGIFNFTSPALLTVREVVEEFFCLYNQKYKKSHKPSFGEVLSNRDTGMPYLALDSSKAFDTFGKPEFTSLQSGLEEYLKQ